MTAAQSALQAARRADADQLTHDEPEIEATGMNQQALQDVRVTAQMRAAHAARVVEMREGAFDPLAASPHQAPAACARESADDCDTPAPGPPAPSTSRVARGPARRCRTGCRRRRGRPSSDCCDTPCRAMISSSGCGSSTSACASSTCSAAAIAVSTIVVVSPSSAPCTVTATIAPVSRSTACSALWARCVRPSFIFVTFASGSCGFVQSLFDVFFLRFRSSRAKSSRVGVSMPEAFASRVRNS